VSVRAPTGKKRRSGALSIADLVGAALTPACRKRGFAAADVLTTWPDIVGARYAECTQPEKLVWPRHDEDDYAPATLQVRCEGHVALLFQHDIPNVIDRINAFLGWRAVERIRIIQRPIVRRDPKRRVVDQPLSHEDEEALTIALDGIDTPRLRAALDRLGRATIGEAKRRDGGD